MWKLLSNMDKEQIFTAENIRHLRAVSWCCAGAAVICAVSALYYPPFIIAAAAAAFMMLIVRIVKNVFQTASDMKSELDLTI
jgi:Flp pilus assembly protein TadB